MLAGCASEGRRDFKSALLENSACIEISVESWWWLEAERGGSLVAPTLLVSSAPNRTRILD